MARIDRERKHSNLSSAIRVFVFEYRRKSKGDDAASNGQVAARWWSI